MNQFCTRRFEGHGTSVAVGCKDRAIAVRFHHLTDVSLQLDNKRALEKTNRLFAHIGMSSEGHCPISRGLSETLNFLLETLLGSEHGVPCLAVRGGVSVRSSRSQVSQ